MKMRAIFTMRGMQPVRLLVAGDKIQAVLDSLQNLLGSHPATRIVVLSVEISLPKPSEEARKEKTETAATREALYVGAEKNARLDLNRK